MNRHAELLARYKHLRQVGLELNTRLVKTLSRSAIDEGGKELGILKGGVLVLDAEDEVAVLMDYCLHDVRRHGANAIERYLAQALPAPESDELVLLRALREARYSLFVVESAEPGVAIYIRDLLRDEPMTLVDVGLSRTAPAGMVFASRVMAPDGIGMTTGASPSGRGIIGGRAGPAPGRVAGHVPGDRLRQPVPRAEGRAGRECDPRVPAKRRRGAGRVRRTGCRERPGARTGRPPGGPADRAERPVPVWKWEEVQALLRGAGVRGAVEWPRPGPAPAAQRLRSTSFSDR